MLSKNYRFTISAKEFNSGTNHVFKKTLTTPASLQKQKTFFPLLKARLSILKRAVQKAIDSRMKQEAFNVKSGNSDGDLLNPIEKTVTTINTLLRAVTPSSQESAPEQKGDVTTSYDIEKSPYKKVFDPMIQLKDNLVSIKNKILSHQDSSPIDLKRAYSSVLFEVSNIDKELKNTEISYTENLLKEAKRGVSINGKRIYIDDAFIGKLFFEKEYPGKSSEIARYYDQSLSLFSGNDYICLLNMPKCEVLFSNKENEKLEESPILKQFLAKTKNYYYSNGKYYILNLSNEGKLIEEEKSVEDIYKEYEQNQLSHDKPNSENKVVSEVKQEKIETTEQVSEKAKNLHDNFERDDSIFKRNGKIYYRTHTDGLELSNDGLKSIPKSEQIKILNGEKLGPIESIFELTDNGFKLVDVGTDSEMIAKMLLGYRIDDSAHLKFLKAHEHVTWKPAPLGFRLHAAFQDIYNPNQNRSTSKAFLGQPDWKNKYNIAEWISPAGGFFGTLTTLKNIFVTFPCEMVPAAIEQTGSWMMDHAKTYFDKQIAKANPDPRIQSNEEIAKFKPSKFKSALAYGGIALGGLLYGIGKATGFVGRRISSPLQSAKDSYEYGLRKGGKPLAIAAAVGSALITGATYAGLAFGAAALVVASPVLLGVAALKHVATAIFSSGPAIVGAVATAATSFIMGAKAFGKWLGSKNNHELKSTSALVKTPDIAPKESKRNSPQPKLSSNIQIDSEMKRKGTSPIPIPQTGEVKAANEAKSYPATPPSVREGSLEGRTPVVEYSPTDVKATNPANLKIMNYPKTVKMDNASPKGKQITHDDLSKSHESDNETEDQKPGSNSP